MISITQAVREILHKQEFISESLHLGLLNTSAYALKIQEEVEKLTFKKVQIGSIVTSLSRIKDDFKGKLEIDFKINDVELKYPVTNLAYDLKLNKIQKIGEIYNLFGKLNDPFLNVIAGNTQINVFVNSKYALEIKDLLKPQKPTLEMEDLAAISLKFDKRFLVVPGMTYAVLRSLFLENINLIEIASTYTEITLFVNKKDSQRILDIMNKEFIG